MGLDYAVNLYYPAGRLGDALRAVARVAPAGPETTIRVPGGEVRVPFTADWRHDPVELLISGSSAGFETALLFPIDDAIAGGKFCHEYEPFADTGCARIGYIYLTVRVGCLYAELSFAAATSGMSRLFVASAAIRGRFRELLAAAGGVAGWLDREDFLFHALDDPEEILTPEVLAGEPGGGWSSPDWLATALGPGEGRPRPEVAAVRACRTADVLALARAVRAGSPELLPLLADALQDAGCASDEMVAHCRDSSLAHVHGCWVVDLVLGKG